MFNDYVDKIDEYADIRFRAELCVKMGERHFKSKLKKYKRGEVIISFAPGIVKK